MNRLFTLSGILFALCVTGCDFPVPEPPPKPEDTIKTPSDGSDTPTSKKRSGPTSNIDAQERIEAISIVEARDPVAIEKKIFKAQTRSSFDDRKFDELEARAKELRESKELFNDGSWKLYHFYEGINDRYHSGEKGFLKDLDTYQAWEEAHPDSLTRRIALVEMLTDYAWHARGTGYADTVSKEQWQSFGARLTEAKRVFERAVEMTEKDPCVWTAGMTIALGMGADKKVFDQMVEASRKQSPEFWHIETSRAYSLLPRWYGEEGDWEKFALEASEQEGGLGAETYARIVMRLQRYYANVYRDARKPSWPLTKEGLVSLREKYPDAMEIDNYCAKLGVSGRDRDFAKPAFERIGDSYVPSAWGSDPEKFVHYRTFARTGRW